jgi:16S rRNA processing protein RimM
MPADGRRVCLGVVTSPHGVRGLVRIKSFTAEPQGVAAYGPLEDERGERRYELELVGSAKGVVLARVAGVTDRDAAERLKGVRLYVSRDVLPAAGEEEYYHADLLGLRVELGDGSELGRVRAVHDFGAGDTLEVMRSEGGAVMVPFTRAVVPVVDLAAGRLVVDPPPGLLDGKTVEAEIENAAGAAPSTDEKETE